jgi:hypothetical protein
MLKSLDIEEDVPEAGLVMSGYVWTMFLPS